MSETVKPHRPIRSFVKREGRFTDAQRHALETLLPKYGITEGDAPLDFAQVFERAAPVHVEIGFGNGDALAAMAAAHPENNYLGLEVHRPGVGALLRRVAAQGLTNVRVANTDAAEFLARRVPDASLGALYLFFPDPWHKKRHHKRRLVQPAFVALVARKLCVGGLWCLATDWEDYARQMMEVLSATPEFENTLAPGTFAPRPVSRPLTRFESRGQRLGHGVWDMVFRRRELP